jgi:excinuclease ABC subunit C
VYGVPGYKGEDRVYLIRRGRVRAEMATPRTAPERRDLERMVAEIFTPRERAGGSVPSHEVDELLLLSSWFRRFPAELERARTAADLPRPLSA